MKTVLFLAVFFLCAEVHYGVRLYKTNEIPFFNDAVQGISEVIGIKPTIVQRKIEVKEKIILQEKKQEEKLLALAKDSVVMEVVPVVAEEKKAVKKEDMFKNVATDETQKIIDVEPKEVASVTEQPVKKKKGLFDNIADGDNSEKTKMSKTSFDVTVFETQDIKNDGSVMLRLLSPLKLAGKEYPQGHVFEASTALSSNRLVLRSDKFGVPVRNYTDGFEGQPLAKQWIDGKTVTLSKGERLTLAY